MQRQKPSWSDLLLGLTAVIAGAVAMHLASSGADFRAWAATDLLIGYGPVLLALFALILGAASPTRARGWLAALAHGLAAGIAWWWAGFAIFAADLFARSDRLFAAFLVVCGSIVLAKFIGGPLLTYAAIRASLRARPRGEGPLLLARALSLGQLDVRSNPDPPLSSPWAHLAKWVLRYRRALRLGSCRTYALEKAVEDAVNAAAARLRRASEARADVSAATQCLADSLAAELDLAAVLLDAKERKPCDADPWVPRVASALDLLRHADRIEPGSAVQIEATVLTSLEQLCRAVPLVSDAARSCRLSEVDVRLVDELASTKGLGALKCLAAVIIADTLLELDLAGWAMGIVEALEREELPRWVKPSLGRLRLTAESMLLRHERWLEPANAAARRVRRGLAAARADAPELAGQAGCSLLPASLRGIVVPAVRRGTGSFPGSPRPGPDQGPGRAVALAILAPLAALAALFITQFHPFGEPFKPLRDIHRSPAYTSAPLSSADVDRSARTLVTGSRGGGVHLVDLRRFRVRSERAGPGGPSSNWVSVVAVDGNGTVAALTNEPPLPGKEAESAGAGVDLRFGPGNWQTQIAARSIPGLRDLDLKAVAPVGHDKLLVFESRLALYRTATREILELRPESPDFALDIRERIIAAASSETEPGRVWLWSEAEKKAEGKLGSMWEVDLLPTNTYRAVREGLPVFAKEGVAQLAAHGGMLSVRTREQRLYEKSSKGWRLRVDGDTKLDLTRIGFVATVAGDHPAVWFIEIDEAGNPRGLRLRLLRTTSLLPEGPWFRCDLVAGVPTSEGKAVTMQEVQLRPDGPSPVALWDPIRQETLLTVAGSKTGLVRFRAASKEPASVADAVLTAERLETPGERVLWLDATEDSLVLVLESLDRGVGRVIKCSSTAISREGLKGSETLQRSWRPDLELLKGARLLTYQDSNGLIDLITNRGRLMTYDRNLHGWTSSKGTVLLDPGGKPIGETISADGWDTWALLVVPDGGVFRLPLSQRPAGVESLQTSLVHAASPSRPPANEKPAMVATEPEGPVLFTAGAEEKCAQPWLLRIGSKVDTGLFGWIKESIETNRPLKVASLTRLQSADSVGPLLAFDAEGTLLYRGVDAWRRPGGTADGWSDFLPAVGGTFVKGRSGIAMVSGGKKPLVSDPLWAVQQEVLRLPVSAMAAVKSDDSLSLVIAHADGLSRYDPRTRTWLQLLQDRSKGPWKLYGRKGNDGTCPCLWAVRQERKRITDIRLVGGASIVKPIEGRVTALAATGDALCVVRENGELLKLQPDGTASSLTGPDSELGDGRFVRAAVSPKGDLWAIDQVGRVLRMSGAAMSMVTAPLPKVPPVRDLAFASDGTLVYLSKDQQLMAWPGAARLPPDMERAEFLESVGKQVIAASPSTGRLSIVDGLQVQVVAGGNPEPIHIGRLSATLVDGDRLWVAGTEGAAVRNPNEGRLRSIEGGAGLDRLEIVGDKVIGWKGNDPFLLNRDIWRALPAFSSILMAPNGSAVGLSSSSKTPTFRGLIGPVPGAQLLFNSDGQLGETIRRAAPLDGTTVAMEGANGTLVTYDLETRSLSTVANAGDLPSEWQFSAVGNHLYVVPGETVPNGDLSALENKKALRVVARKARSPVRTPDRLAWIESDGSVREVDVQGRVGVLTKVAAEPSAKQSTTKSIIVDSRGVLWWLTGREARGYDPSTGPLPGPFSAEGVALVDGKAVRIVSSGESHLEVRRLDGKGDVLSSMPAQRVRAGDSKVLLLSHCKDLLQIECLCRSPFSQSKRIAPGREIADLATPGSWAAVGDRYVYVCGKELNLYDATTGVWKSSVEVPSTSVGVVGSTVVGVRSRSTGAAVLDFFEPGSILPSRSAELCGDAAFDGERYLLLKPTEGGGTSLGFEAANGKFEELRRFEQATEPFAIQRSKVAMFPNGLSVLFLAGLPGKTRDRLLLASAQEIRPVEGLAPGFAVDGSSAEVEGDRVVITNGAKTAVIDASPGNAFGRVLRTSMKFGRIGPDLWTIHKDRAGQLRILRAMDDQALEPFLATELRALLSRAVDAVFQVKRVPVPTRPVEKAKSGRTLDPCNGDSVSVLGRQLDPDGWFRDCAPSTFRVAGKGRTTVTVVMRNGREEVVSLPRPIQQSPPPGSGGFKVNDGQLTWNDRAVLGRPIAETAMAADQWVDAMPAGAREVYSVDGSGQIWWWTEQRGELQRAPVALPNGAKVKSLALPASGDEERVVVLGPGDVAVAVIKDGKALAAPALEAVAEPGQREGRAGPVRWRRTAQGGMEFFLRCEGNAPLEDVVLPMNPSGLSVDQPRGLCLLPGDRNPWLDLGRAESGRRLVCPTKPTPIARAEGARLVARVESPPEPAPFQTGTLEFSPTVKRGPQGAPEELSWRVQVRGTEVPVRGGRFAIDQVKRATTTTDGSKTNLYLLTDMPGLVVRQAWAARLGPPELMVLPDGDEGLDLRTQGGKPLVNLRAGGWVRLDPGGWKPCSPAWQCGQGRASRWHHAPATGDLSYDGQRIEVVNRGQDFFFGPDVLSKELEEGGGPRVREDSGGISFQSASGSWYAWWPGRPIAERLQAPPEPPARELTLQVSGSRVRVPRRSRAGAKYYVDADEGDELQLPWVLKGGRLPHNVVETVTPYGPIGVQARLAGGVGYRLFTDVGAALRLRLGGQPFPDPLPPPDLSVHDEVELSHGVRLRWKSQENFALELLGSGTLMPCGRLQVRGIPLDDASEVLPVAFRDGKVEFVFRGQLWSRAPQGGLENCVLMPGKPDSKPTGLSVDPQTRRIVLQHEPELRPDLAPKLLGRFTDDGKWDENQFVGAHITAKKTHSVRLRRGSDGLDLPIEPAKDGWACVFERPRAVVHHEDDLIFLGSDSRNLARWFREKSGTWTWRGGGPLNVNVAWLGRSGKNLVAGLADGSGPKVIHFDRGPTPVMGDKAEDGSFEAAPGTFAFQRDPSSGVFRVLLAAAAPYQGEVNPWKELPGTMIDRALWLNGDALLLQDGHGLQCLELNPRRFGRVLARPPGTDSNTRLRRFLYHIRLENELVNRSDDNEERIQLTRAKEAGSVKVSHWVVQQASVGAPVVIKGIVQGSNTLLLLGDDASVTPGALATDRCTCIVEDPQNGVIAVTPAGAWSDVADNALVPFEGDSRTLASRDDLQVLRSEDGSYCFGSAAKGDAIDIASGRVVSAESLKEYLYFGKPDDWRIYREGEVLVIDRPVESRGVRLIDVLRGPEIFAEGQFSFDRVENVWCDVSDSLIVETGRAWETVDPNERKAGLQVINLRFGTVSPPSAQPKGAAVPTLDISSPRQRWRVPIDGRVFSLQLDEQRGGTPNPPKIFLADGRLWLVCETGIYWLETTRRWEQKRLQKNIQESAPLDRRRASAK